MEIGRARTGLVGPGRSLASPTMGQAAMRERGVPCRSQTGARFANATTSHLLPVRSKLTCTRA